MNKETYKEMISKWWPMVILLLVTVVRYIIVGKVVMLDDSIDYINCSNVARPLYPIFLTGLCVIFGKNYLFVAGIIQNLILAISCYVLYSYAKKYLKLKGVLSSLTLLTIMIMPHLVHAIGSREYIILSDAILSEGLSYSLYNLYIACIMRSCIEKSWKWYSWSSVMCVLVMLVRPQLLFVVVMQVIVLVFMLCRDTSKKKYWYVLSLLFILFIFSGINAIYLKYMASHETFYGINGSFAIRIYYTADITDVELLETDDAKKVFMEVKSAMDADGIGYQQWGNGIIQDARCQEDSYTTIDNYQHQKALLLAETKGISDNESADLFGAEIAKEIVENLFTNHFARQVRYYINYVCEGMIRSIAIWRPLFVVIGIGLYIFYFTALIIHILRKKMDNLTIVALIALLLLVGNVFSSSMAIMCLSRYMIYNMSIFYIALFAEVMEVKKKMMQWFKIRMVRTDKQEQVS